MLVTDSHHHHERPEAWDFTHGDVTPHSREDVTPLECSVLGAYPLDVYPSSLALLFHPVGFEPTTDPVRDLLYH